VCIHDSAFSSFDRFVLDLSYGEVDVRTVGKELGARYVMEGSLRQAGSRLRIAVQLLDASTGAQLWAETYDSIFRPGESFTLQDASRAEGFHFPGDYAS
jgi:TolB-like protein